MCELNPVLPDTIIPVAVGPDANDTPDSMRQRRIPCAVLETAHRSLGPDDRWPTVDKHTIISIVSKPAGESNTQQYSRAVSEAEARRVACRSCPAYYNGCNPITRIEELPNGNLGIHTAPRVGRYVNGRILPAGTYGPTGVISRIEARANNLPFQDVGHDQAGDYHQVPNDTENPQSGQNRDQYTGNTVYYGPTEAPDPRDAEQFERFGGLVDDDPTEPIRAFVRKGLNIVAGLFSRRK